MMRVPQLCVRAEGESESVYLICGWLYQINEYDSVIRVYETPKHT